MRQSLMQRLQLFFPQAALYEVRSAHTATETTFTRIKAVPVLGFDAHHDRSMHLLKKTSIFYQACLKHHQLCSQLFPIQII